MFFTRMRLNVSQLKLWESVNDIPQFSKILPVAKMFVG